MIQRLRVGGGGSGDREEGTAGRGRIRQAAHVCVAWCRNRGGGSNLSQKGSNNFEFEI
jgi:hypothetical protein